MRPPEPDCRPTEEYRAMQTPQTRHPLLQFNSKHDVVRPHVLRMPLLITVRYCT